ncbi:MAG: putative 3'-5' exonuclease, partial [Streblomastix strix]
KVGIAKPEQEKKTANENLFSQTCIHLDNLPGELNESELRAEFQGFAIKDIIITRREDGSTAGFCLIDFSNESDQKRSIEQKQCFLLKGKEIAIRAAYKGKLSILIAPQIVISEPRPPTNKFQPPAGFPRQIVHSFPIELLNTLPQFQFRERISIITQVYQAQQVVQRLLKEDCLGFDTESQINWNGGPNNLTIVQIANRHEAWIFIIRALRGISALIPLFTSDVPQKVCFAVTGDIDQLRSIQQFEPHGFVEVADVSRMIGVSDTGMQRLCANLLGVRIDKKESTSNWGRNILTDKQIVYAATDAFVSRWVYESVWEYKRRGLSLPPIEHVECKEEECDVTQFDLEIGNIDSSVTQKQLKRVFQQEGFFIRKVVFNDQIIQIHRQGQMIQVKSGLLMLDNEDICEQIIDKMNGIMIGKTAITLKKSELKVSRKAQQQNKIEQLKESQIKKEESVSQKEEYVPQKEEIDSKNEDHDIKIQEQDHQKEEQDTEKEAEDLKNEKSDLNHATK